MYRHVIAYTVTDSSAICVAYGSSECIAYSDPYADAYAGAYASTYGIAHERYECVTDFISDSCTIGIADVRSVSCSYS